MKTNCWLVLGTMLATAAVAQVNTNKLPEIPAPATAATVAPVTTASTNAVAPVAKKKAVVKKKVVKKISEPSVSLVPGPATVTAANLNLRGQAGLKGEAVGHLKAGDTVNVIAQINLDKHAADEPAQWAKISLPSGNKVWVDSKYVDATNKVVSVKKLNLRAGPGENYSVLGAIEKGTPVNELAAKGNWSQIETPTNAFAFVAAMYLKQEAAPAIAPTPPAPPVIETPVVTTPVVTTPPPTTSTVAEAPPIVTQPPVAPVAPVVDTNASVAATTPVVTDTNAAASVVDTNLPPPPPRVVSHEGYVRPSVSLVAPTFYELYDTESGNAINYLYSTSTNLDISRYNNYDIIVTGEEGMSPRWKDTPVITIQKIYVVSTNPPTPYKPVASPHAISNRSAGKHR
jgi:uncharacterized protein YgiM (DUF1202 family)